MWAEWALVSKLSSCCTRVFIGSLQNWVQPEPQQTQQRKSPKRQIFSFTFYPLCPAPRLRFSSSLKSKSEALPNSHIKGELGILGKAVPSYRIAIEEINKWSGFARALRKDDREAFEELMDMSRSFVMASGNKKS
jgi:hypothetical protein